jgi:hypothetical protein
MPLPPVAGWRFSTGRSGEPLAVPLVLPNRPPSLWPFNSPSGFDPDTTPIGSHLMRNREGAGCAKGGDEWRAESARITVQVHRPTNRLSGDQLSLRQSRYQLPHQARTGAGARHGQGAPLLASPGKNYGVPGCERLPVTATIGLVKPHLALTSIHGVAPPTVVMRYAVLFMIVSR